MRIRPMATNTELCPKWENPARREIAAYPVAPALIRKPAPPLLYLPFINENDKGNDRKQSAAAICGNKAFLRTGLHWRDVLVSFLKTRFTRMNWRFAHRLTRVQADGGV
jgi:hypothetical protein